MPIKVTVIKESSTDHFLLNDPLSTIGRRSDCDISIRDPSVSGLHAQIRKVGENFLIQDLDSTNGVFLKGRKIKQHVIKHNDVVFLGEHQIAFALVSELTANSPERVDINSPERVDIDCSETDETSCAIQEASIGFLSGPSSGTVTPLSDALTTVGLPGIQIASISTRPQGHFIIHVDGGKEQGKVPLVNGDAIGFKSRKLEAGDKIEVAGVLMEYLPN